jgi:hypothetical protein
MVLCGIDLRSTGQTNCSLVTILTTVLPVFMGVDLAFSH